MHSYRLGWGGYGSEPDPESVDRDNLASRALLDSISARWRGIPMLCTEWGYPSSVVDPATQSAYLVRTYLANLASGVTATVWYEWKDSRDEVSNPESHFGLQTMQGAFKAEPDEPIIRQLRHMKLVRRLEAGDPEIQALLFDDEGTQQVVAWLRSDNPSRSVSVSVGGKSVTLHNRPTIISGNQITVSDVTHAR
jgi:hypothetical protein